MFIGFFKTLFIFYKIIQAYLQSSTDLEKNKLLKQKWALEVLDLIGLQLKMTGSPSPNKQLILVGNHISYLDIVVLFAAYPNCVFLAKSEVSKWPIIGPAAKRIGTIFVHRESKTSRASSKRQIQDLLQSQSMDIQIAAFPSGTTTLHEETPWKKGLFEIAQNADVKIQPFKISYSHPRECAYIDNDQLFSSLIKLFSIQNKTVSLTWGQAFKPVNIEADIENTRLWAAPKKSAEMTFNGCL